MTRNADITTRPGRHLCIATGQNLANLIPALQLSAAEVVILETAAMAGSAQNLARALKAHDIKVRGEKFDDSTPESVTRSAEKIALDLGEDPLVFNATGGHKLMVLALMDQLQIADALHVVYAETRDDRLDWLRPIPTVERMADVLDLDDILRTQGYLRKVDSHEMARWEETAAAHAELTRWTGDHADRLGGFIGVLNKLADLALNGNRGTPRFAQEFDFPPGGDARTLLKLAQRLNLISWDGKRNLVFLNESSAKYLRGGWLEDYVWLKLRGLKPHAWAVRVKTETYRTKVENEFDALVAHRNRLLVIECKTGALGTDPHRSADYIYKLAQLAEKLGGSMAGKLLLSARPIPEEVRQRAVTYGVDILAQSEVGEFVRYMRGWMGGSST
jgi:hypothetical protein